MKTRYLILLMLLSLVGCSGTREFYTQHFVTVYYNTEAIKLYNGYSEDDDQIDYYYDYYGYKLVSIFTKSFPSTVPPFYDAGQSVSKEEYEALCIKHGDLTYNRSINFNEPGHQHTNLDFTHIAIVSDEDFDESHPTGVDLGDIVMFNSTSPIQYIRSGYIDMVTIGNIDGSTYKSPYHTIAKLVSELVADDMVLLGGGRDWLAELQFFSKPTIAQTHNITVTMTADDGRIFTDTVQVSWE